MEFSRAFFIFFIAFFAFSLSPDQIQADVNTETVYVYFSDGQYIQYVDPALGSLTTIVDLGSSVDAKNVVLDTTHQHIYWYDRGNSGEIKRSTPSGGNIATIISGLGLITVYGMALDEPSQKIYFTDKNTGQLFRVNFDGTGLTTLKTGLSDPIGIDIDLTNSKLYIAQFASGNLTRCNLEATSCTDILNEGAYEISSVAVNPSEGKIYYGLYTSYLVKKANLDGTSPSTVISSGLPQVFSLAIHPSSSQLFLSSSGGWMFKSGMDGSGLTHFLSGTSGYPLFLSAVGESFLTPIPTITPTLTVTATPTSTMTVTSTPTSSPVHTATPSATPTTRQEVTATPTTVPTSSNPQKIDVVVMVNGQPVSGVLAYIAGVGTCLTDSEGRCSISGLEAGALYQVVVQKTGVVFDNPEFVVSQGQAVVANGTSVQYNPMNCSEDDQAAKLDRAAEALATILSWGKADFGRLGPSTTVGLDDAQKASVASRIARLERLYNYYLDSSKLLPEICLDCSDMSGCTSIDLSLHRSLMLKQLDNIKHEALYANRVLHIRGTRSQAHRKKRVSQINKQANLTRKDIKKLLTTTWVCS